MVQTVLTFITKVNHDKRQELEQLLELIQRDLDSNPYISFSSLTLLHFASFVIIDDDNFDSYLVFENNFDGALDSYLNELTKTAGEGLHEIYSCCSDYMNTTYDQKKLIAYLHDKVVRPNAYHVGNVGRTAKQIRQQSQMREKIQTFLDEVVKSGGRKESPASLRESIQQFVYNLSSPPLEMRLPPRQTLAERIVPWLKIIGYGLCAFLLLPILIPVFIIWVIVLRKREKRDSEGAQQANASHVRELVEREDRIVQNHLANITIVKPGGFRRVTLRIVLWVANLLARTSNKGELAGIPSIHFAHWSLIDKGRRLLFLSNYDGSWISYLDDFIDKASLGLTGIWSNTMGFPQTRFLVLDGAKNEAEFKAFARGSQVRTLVWYSAYPNLTVQNIDNDSLIREDLLTPLDDGATKNWLQLF